MLDVCSFLSTIYISLTVKSYLSLTCIHFRHLFAHNMYCNCLNFCGILKFVIFALSINARTWVPANMMFLLEILGRHYKTANLSNREYVENYKTATITIFMLDSYLSRTCIYVGQLFEPNKYVFGLIIYRILSLPFWSPLIHQFMPKHSFDLVQIGD